MLVDSSRWTPKCATIGGDIAVRRQPVGRWSWTHAAMVATAACLWGLSGTAAEWLMHADGVSPTWLTTVRMGVTGLVLLGVLRVRSGPRAWWGIWRRPSGLPRFLFFSLVGLTGVQFTYLAAIAASNAATATLLQYLAPILLVGMAALAARHPITLWQGALMVAAALGTWLLVSGGRGTSLVISPAGLAWGLLAAGTLALYTWTAPPLLRQHGTVAVMAWSMLVGAAALSLVRPPTLGPTAWTWPVAGLVATVALGGTLLAFGLFLASLSHIPPTTAAWLAAVEPVAAGVSAHAFLHVPLNTMQVAGGATVLAAAGLLAGASVRGHGGARVGDPIMAAAYPAVPGEGDAYGNATHGPPAEDAD